MILSVLWLNSFTFFLVKESSDIPLDPYFVKISKILNRLLK